MRDWRRMVEWSGGFMFEKRCHDLDIYNMATASRPVRVASFGGRQSYIPQNAPTSNAENEIMHVKKSVDGAFHSDGDIIDWQTSTQSCESGAGAAFHTNLNVPDRHRRFCIMGTHGMAEGDFVRGYLKVTARDGTVVADHRHAEDEERRGNHYGADDMMLADIDSLPVGIVDAMEAGIVALAPDKARITGRMIDLADTWARLDAHGLWA